MMFFLRFSDAKSSHKSVGKRQHKACLILDCKVKRCYRNGSNKIYTVYKTIEGTFSNEKYSTWYHLSTP